jgi:hypothetical protein
VRKKPSTWPIKAVAMSRAATLLMLPRFFFGADGEGLIIKFSIKYSAAVPLLTDKKTLYFQDRRFTAYILTEGV